MPFPTYPTSADIEALLKSSAYWPADPTKQQFASLQADIGARAAVDEWERLTGWSPFLAATGATARTFEVKNGRVDFEGAALSVEGVLVDGKVLDSYGLEPANALVKGTAITGLLNIASGGAVVVTARWGRVTQVPGDVFQAIQQKAALIALTQIENLQSVASISEDGFTKAYDTVGIVTQKDLVQIWGRDFEKIAGRWQRVVS